MAAPEGGWYGLAICFAFFFELGETCVGQIAAYPHQRGVLEVGLPVVGLGVRHCLVWSTFGSPS